MPNPSRFFQYVVISALIGAAPLRAGAAEATDAVSQQFAVAAQAGPRALLDELAQLLAANPGLAASPGTAAELARAAAAPVPDFVGANLPIYREIAEKIVAAAPADQRVAVRSAIGHELTRYVATDIQIMPPLLPTTTGTLPTQPPEVGGTGFKVGSFTVYPEIQAGTFYDNNIYATRTARVTDLAVTLSPRLEVQSNWDRHALYADFGTDFTNYASHVGENTVDWHSIVEGRIDVDNDTRIVLGGVALQEHEDRSSPDAVEGITPTPYYQQNGYFGVLHRFGDINVRVGGGIERITFGNVMGTNGEINNQDRNRNRYTMGALVRDDAREDFQPFVEALADLRRYDQTVDDFGYQRNSDGYRAGLGTIFRMSSDISGNIFAGIIQRTYTDQRFKPVTTFAIDGNLRWQIGEDTAIVAFLDRSVEESTLPGSPAYIYSVLGGRIEQALRPDLTAFFRAAVSRADFLQVGRSDDEADISIGARYYVTEKLYLGVDTRYTQRVAGTSIYSFSRNQLFLTVGSAF